MATVSVSGLGKLDLSQVSLAALSNPANYQILEQSNSVIAFKAGDFSYRLTGNNLFALGTPGSTITSLKVTFGQTTFDIAGIDLDFATLFQKILSGDPNAAGFEAFLTGNDTVLGTDLGEAIRDLVGHNVIQGGGGSDTLTGGSGNDHIYGQSPNGGSDGGDLISGGGGSDYINGNAGNDTISGGDGSDRIQGGQDNDSLSGDAGNDTINGNRGDDQIFGGDGHDSLRGGQGDDTIEGGAGDDSLSGDLGADRLTGGAGADRFIFAAGGSAIGATLDSVTDFQQGSDLISLGFTPAAVLVGTGTAATIDAARSAAQALFDGHAGNQEVAAINLQGGSTLIFWSSTGGATIDSAASFLSQSATDFGASDFF